MPVRIFIHGLESGNMGTKSVFFRDTFPDMILPNFKGDLQERMKKLENVLSGKSRIRLVGSSFGGLMATLFAIREESRIERIVLLAPALNYLSASMKGEKTISTPVKIYHGRDDDVIPLEEVEPVAKKTFKNLSFHEVDDDHFLHKTFKTLDWEDLLS